MSTSSNTNIFWVSLPGNAFSPSGKLEAEFATDKTIFKQLARKSHRVALEAVTNGKPSYAVINIIEGKDGRESYDLYGQSFKTKNEALAAIE
jgi:hypothetical protein